MLVAGAAFAQKEKSDEIKAKAPVSMKDVDKGKGVVEVDGQVIVPGSPQQTYTAATDFERWAKDMTDISDVEVREHTKTHAVVVYTSTILGPRTTLTFDLHPESNSFDLKLEGAGFGDVTGQMKITAAGEGKSQATLTTTSKRVGGLTNLIPAGIIRDRVKRKAESDLRVLYWRMVTDPPQVGVGGSGQPQPDSQSNQQPQQPGQQ